MNSARGKAVHTTFAQMRRRDDPKDPATAAWLSAIARFHAAVDAAYPPGFWDDVALLAKADPSGLETAMRFFSSQSLSNTLRAALRPKKALVIGKKRSHLGSCLISDRAR